MLRWSVHRRWQSRASGDKLGRTWRVARGWRNPVWRASAAPPVVAIKKDAQSHGYGAPLAFNVPALRYPQLQSI